MTTLDVPVVEVVVMEDRARVVRRGTILVVLGAQRVTVTGVAPVLADKTVAARAVGADIVDTRVRRTTAGWRDGDPDASATTTALVERRRLHDAARDRARELGDQIELAQQAAVATDALMARASSEMALAAAWGVGPANARARFEELTSRSRDEHVAAATLAIDVQVAHDEVARLAAQIADLLCAVSHESAVIEIDLVAAAAGTLELELVYVVPGACWRPYHTATWRDATLEFATDACVWQATGEDWRDVVLRCSTARPSLGAAPPMPTDDVLQVRAKAPLVAQVREQAIATTGLGRAPRTGDEVPGVDDGGTVQIITAANHASIVADGQPHRVRLSAWSAPIEASVVAYPELVSAAIVRTQQVHAGAAPILAGPVDLVRDGGLTGRTTVLFVAPGERFALAWGADPTVRVHRTHREKHDDAGVLSNWSQTRHRVAVRLSNLGATARTVTVTERIPVSELVDKVEIVLRAADAWQLEDDDGTRRDLTPRVVARTVADDGMISWQVELPPRQRRAIAHEYIVKMHASVQ